jgi:hypothetical protein
MTVGRIVIDLRRTLTAQTKSETVDGLVIYKRVTHQIQIYEFSHASIDWQSQEMTVGNTVVNLTAERSERASSV